MCPIKRPATVAALASRNEPVHPIAAEIKITQERLCGNKADSCRQLAEDGQSAARPIFIFDGRSYPHVVWPIPPHGTVRITLPGRLVSSNQSSCGVASINSHNSARQTLSVSGDSPSNTSASDAENTFPHANRPGLAVPA